MLTLLVIIHLLQTCIRKLVHRAASPSRPRYGYKHPHPADRNDHRHSPRKPEWLKNEIIHLKALMPQAGCRSIADICNRRYRSCR